MSHCITCNSKIKHKKDICSVDGNHVIHIQCIDLYFDNIAENEKKQKHKKSLKNHKIVFPKHF